MSFNSENGYTPVSFETLMDLIRQGINAQFNSSWTPENFIGTNFYKYFYVLVQRVLENENKASEIFIKLQQYISLTNQRIQRPSVSLPGLIDSFQSRGYIAAVKPMIPEDRGRVYIAVDVDYSADDYPAKKLEIGTLIKDFVVAGVISMGGEEVDIILSNGQEFTFRFYLPYFTDMILRITIDKSDNHAGLIPDDETIRSMILANFNARYRLGWDFEPQRYFTQQDAPWAASILLEYSTDDGETWSSDVKQLLFYDKVRFSLEDIQVEINP